MDPYRLPLYKDFTPIAVESLHILELSMSGREQLLIEADGMKLSGPLHRPHSAVIPRKLPLPVETT